MDFGGFNVRTLSDVVDGNLSMISALKIATA